MKFYLFLFFLYFVPSLTAQVGIGTTNPVSKVHVSGDTASPSKTGSSQNSLLRLSNTSDASVLDLGISKDNYSWIQVRNSSNYGLSYPLLLNPNCGNVGIGNKSASEKLTVIGSIHATGTIRSSSPGQLIHSVFLTESDLGVSNTISNASTSETTVATYTYSPISSSSKVYIEFDARASISGSVSDEFAANLYVGSTLIQNNKVLFVTNQGGGGRGNSLFPINGYFTNSSTGNMIVAVKIKRVSSDDTITVDPDMTLIIQEVAQ
jgi:hypothetical protein